MAIKDPSLDNLVDYIAGGDGMPRAWADMSLTVDLGGLSGDMLASARAALDMWTATAGFEFNEVSTGGDITFDDTDTGAYAATSFTDEGEILSVLVNVDDNWMDGFPVDERWGQGDYGLQTFIHEIGHALGLQHPGPYNGDGTYEGDAIFAKDTWQYSIMSYFDQESPDQFLTPYFISSPALADIAAIEKLYGEISINEGDTVFTAESMKLIDSSNSSFTVHDSGGVDTLDLRSYDLGMRLDLRPGSFSTFGFWENNFAIALDTTIENAKGTKNGDRIVGNRADNQLYGFRGEDALNGGAGDDTIDGGTGKSGNGRDGDILVGGSGDDTFVFGAANTFKDDRILDFKTGSDTLMLSKIDADTTVEGNQDFDFIGKHAFGGEAGELRYKFKDGKTLLSGDLDGDGMADFGLALKGKIAFDADDFIL